MNDTGPLVVGLGELLWDILPDSRTPGGGPANFAFHAAQVGGRGVVVSAVGSDGLGRELLAWLDQVGLSPGHVQINGRPTGQVAVRIEDGHPHYSIRSDVAWDAIAWTDDLAALAVRADCVCVGSLAQRSPDTRRTIARFFETARQDCLRVVDVNLRPTGPDLADIDPVLRSAGLLKLNHLEWPVLARHFGVPADPLLGMRQLLRSTRLRWVVMTRGERGSLVVDADAVHDLPGRPVAVADTVGAGDSFTATLVVDLLRGVPTAAAHRHAADVAAYVCTQPGATPALPASLSCATPVVRYAVTPKRPKSVRVAKVRSVPSAP